LADAFEAIIAAIYIDGGLEKARKFIFEFLLPEMKNFDLNHLDDYKSMLQEKVQRRHDSILDYKLIKSEGPDHDKKFWVEVHLNGNAVGLGQGKSKKEAEQQAACSALASISSLQKHGG
jgi:ribonuclease-3